MTSVSVGGAWVEQGTELTWDDADGPVAADAVIVTPVFDAHRIYLALSGSKLFVSRANGGDGGGAAAAAGGGAAKRARTKPNAIREDIWWALAMLHGHFQQ